MNDAIMRDIIAGAVITVYLWLLATNQVVNSALASMSLICFGYFFKSPTAGGWQMGNPFKKAVPVLILFMLLGMGTAKADIFNPIGPGTQGKYKTYLASVNGPSGSTLADLSTVLNYLGATTGEAYNARLGQWDTTVGATVVSLPAYYTSVGAETLLALHGGSLIDGWAETNSFNIGQFLADHTSVGTIPVLQYLSQASFSLSFGEEQNKKGNYQFAPLIGGSIKWSFGPQGS